MVKVSQGAFTQKSKRAGGTAAMHIDAHGEASINLLTYIVIKSVSN